MSLLADYLAFAKNRPELFENPPGAGFIILLDENEIHAAEEQAAQRLKAMGQPTEWAQVGFAYQDQYLLLLRDAVRYTDGSLGTYIRVVNQYPGVLGVVILPVYGQQILLVRHFRHATRTWHLEIPRGFGLSTSSEENAQRELAEEIGASPIRLLSLGTAYPDTGANATSVDFFYAEVDTYGNRDTNEGITDILSVPFAEFERLIRDNEITDGFTLIAYARAKTHGLLGVDLGS